MSRGLRILQALPIAAADLAVGGLLARHVSVTIGVLLATFGVFVLFTAIYRSVGHTDPAEAGRRHPT
jgi:hypothetical protein